jgi:hypothetical protein
VRNDFFGEMTETGGVPLNASPVRRWAGVFGHRPFAFSISMGSQIYRYLEQGEQKKSEQRNEKQSQKRTHTEKESIHNQK